MAKTITISAIRKDNKYPVVYTYKGAPNMFGGFDHSLTYRKVHALSAIQAHTLNAGDTLVNNSGQPDSYFFPDS